MENIGHGIRNPISIDVKIGRVATDPDAPPEKVQAMRLRYPVLEKIGFKICGIKVCINANASPKSV